ncbi:MAG: glucose-6-phosphate dehydrogenase (NADP(+)), partial [Comamonadaceae bacterium]
DMIQNHIIQLLCLVALEPPASDAANALRDEKLKVLRSLKPITNGDVGRCTVRGQYRAGSVDGASVAGYQDELPEDKKGSRTETFVALKAEIENWRWAGVPFYIRTGKRLAAREAHIVVNFREAPHAIFSTPPGAVNRLVIHLQPRDGLQLHMLAQGSGNRRGNSPMLSPVHLDLDFDKRFGAERVGAYERLLLDVLDGRLNLFVRRDEQEEAWRWVEPILQYWRDDQRGPRPYAAGTWGPSPSSALVARDGHCWPEEC